MNEGANCIVYGCTNKQGSGRFVGVLCFPCHDYIANKPSASVGHSQAWRNAYETVRQYNNARAERIAACFMEIESLVDLANYPAWYKVRQEIELLTTHRQQCPNRHP